MPEVRTVARKPDYNGTETISWASVKKTFEAYRDGYYKFKGVKPVDPNKIPKRIEEAPQEMRSWIAKKSLLGRATGKTFEEVLFFPVVNPNTNKLNEGALRAVISGRGAQANIPETALKSARRMAYKLLIDEFDADLEIPDELKAEIEKVSKEEEFKELTLGIIEDLVDSILS